MSSSELKNIIIGTAGHVDHGKTRLIKALSGIDTDRLEEEKKRGITIELGFAHIPNDAGYNIGVIDVPGHEKFIKNMLAGIGGIDFVLFVVAADEGIMPQTKEHFEILSALGIDDGIIAVTKTDMVDEEWLEMLLEDVGDYFKGSFLDGKPVIPVSSATGDNLDVLKEAIIAKCDRENKRRSEKELFRLPVDRVFTMQGFGTVVTGTLMDGAVSVGDDVRIYPADKKAKVRGIQTYGKETDKAIAGQRTAINLSGIDKSDIDRGDVLAFEGSVSASSMLDVKFSVFKSSDRVVLNGSRVHLYTGSSEVLTKVVLLDRDTLSAGEECYAQLRLEEPLALRRGDKFIIRFYSPMITIGGGTVLDSMPAKHKRNREDVLAGLKTLDEGSLRDIIILKTGERKFIKDAELAKTLGLLKSEISGIIDDEIAAGNLIKLADSNLLSRSKFEGLKKDLEQLINDYHSANPLADGMPKQELLSRLRRNWHIEDEKLLQALVKYMLDQNVIKDMGKSIALAGFKIEYTAEQLALKEKIAGMYEKAGIEMLKNDEILELGKDKKAIRAMQEDLCEEGRIVKLNPSYYIAADAWEKAVEAARSFDKGFAIAEYRDRLETSRKYASELLDAMDKKGITKFNGEVREVIGR